jgi:hypothetical protein
MKEISEAYMQKIGFGEQPYLVYQHFDSGHPHIHIVSIKVRADGTRIDTHNIGRNQSEKARKEIELNFGLIKAENTNAKAYTIKLAYTSKIEYGRSDSRRAIANVLDGVLNAYKYTSLAELNAVLQQYNVLADRCSEGSRVHQNQGLLYRILDEKGKPVGVPIKASSFYNKPTLKYIEERFTPNEAARLQHRARLKNAINLAMLRESGKSLESLTRALEKEGINTVIRQNKEGIIYGLTYVDHRTKCIFNGSDLGKEYSAKGIQERCNVDDRFNQNKDSKHPRFTNAQEAKGNVNYVEQKSIIDVVIASNIGKAVEDLTQPMQTSNYVPHQLKKRKKNKRKNNTDNI